MPCAPGHRSSATWQKAPPPDDDGKSTPCPSDGNPARLNGRRSTNDRRHPGDTKYRQPAEQ
eukprot:11157965-Lingulodinium_polyedra.AAC.1